MYTNWKNNRSESVLITYNHKDSSLNTLDSIVFCIVTAREAPGATVALPGITQNIGQNVGKVITVIAEEVVVPITTTVVPGTSFEAPDADLAVSGRRSLQTFVTPAYAIFILTYPDYCKLFATKEKKNSFNFSEFFVYNIL